MNVKTFDNVKGVLRKANAKDIELFVDKGYNLIQGFVNIYTLLVEEKDYKGDLVPGLDFTDYQLNELEEILMTKIDSYGVSQVRRILNYGFIGEGKDSERLIESVNKLESIIKEIDTAVTDFVYFDTSELNRLRVNVKSSLSDFIYGYVNTLDLFTTVGTISSETVHIQVNLNNYLTKNAIAVDKFVEFMFGLLGIFTPTMEVMEKYPEEWEAFINDIPYEFVGDVYEFMDVVEIEDIIKYREGKIDVDDDFISVLRKRAFSLGGGE